MEINGFLIDPEDFEKISTHKWKINKGGYVCRTINKNGLLYLHRFIMDASKGQEIDHIDGNKLDNRKSNLRFCTKSQNSYNRKSLNYRKRNNCDSYEVYFKIDGKQKSWYFKDEISAINKTIEIKNGLRNW